MYADYSVWDQSLRLGFVSPGASPYSMGPASQGTPTPMMSPAPPGGPQDSMGYNMNMNGGDYNSSMSGSQVSWILWCCFMNAYSQFKMYYWHINLT